MNKEVDQEVTKMWRAFFLAIGISLIIVGAECMVVHKAVLAGERSAATETSTTDVSVGSQEFKPPEWAPWSLIAGGAVIVLYSYSLPKRFGNG